MKRRSKQAMNIKKNTHYVRVWLYIMYNGFCYSVSTNNEWKWTRRARVVVMSHTWVFRFGSTVWNEFCFAVLYSGWTKQWNQMNKQTSERSLYVSLFSVDASCILFKSMRVFFLSLSLLLLLHCKWEFLCERSFRADDGLDHRRRRRRHRHHRCVWMCQSTPCRTTLTNVQTNERGQRKMCREILNDGNNKWNDFA